MMTISTAIATIKMNMDVVLFMTLSQVIKMMRESGSMHTVKGFLLKKSSIKVIDACQDSEKALLV